MADVEIAACKDGLIYQIITKPVHPKELLRKVSEMLASAPAVPVTGEDRARLRTVENMKQTIAAVQADIAITIARRRSSRKRYGTPARIKFASLPAIAIQSARALYRLLDCQNFQLVDFRRLRE